MIIMTIFNMSISCFHQNSFHYFEDFLMMETDLLRQGIDDL
jgi:hypothetical protein